MVSWLVVVRRDRPDLYERLRVRLQGKAIVVLDRRSPQESRMPSLERRLPLSRLDGTTWWRRGYRRIRVPGGIPVDTPRSRLLEGRSVLIVEDHADSANATRLMLEWLGARVAVARNGDEALALIAAAPPDVVLCDLRLPGMTGWEVARRVRSNPELPGIRLVALTGFTEERTRMARGGFDGYLLKPVDEAALLGAVLGTRAVAGTERRPPSSCSACGTRLGSGGTLLFQGEQLVHALCWRDSQPASVATISPTAPPSPPP